MCWYQCEHQDQTVFTQAAEKTKKKHNYTKGYRVKVRVDQVVQRFKWVITGFFFSKQTAAVFLNMCINGQENV